MPKKQSDFWKGFNTVQSIAGPLTNALGTAQAKKSAAKKNSPVKHIRKPRTKATPRYRGGPKRAIT